MERNTYTRDSLERAMVSYESRYGFASDDFYRLYVEDDAALLESVPGFVAHVWASFYREARGTGGARFAEQADRLLPA